MAVSFWRRVATPLRLLFVALLVLATCGPGVIAENGDSGATFFVRERQRQEQVQQLQLQRRSVATLRVRAAPQGQLQRRPRRPIRPSSRLAAPAQIERTAPVGEKRAPAYFVAVLGDSLAVLLHQGLQEAFADQGELAFARKARESSGLVREDFYNWQKAAADLLNGQERLDLAVMMVGSNDRQALRDGTVDVEPLSPRWREIYAARVEAFMRQFRERGVKLVWVGMPPMRVEKMSSDLAELNEIYRQAAGRSGVAYVDIWDAFLNDSGKYDANGPDVNGAVVKLRTIDGVHLTKAGARKAAHFLEADIKRAFEATRPATDPDLAALLPTSAAPAPPPAPPVARVEGPAPPEDADLDLNSLIRRQIGAPAPTMSAEASLQASLVLPPEPPPIVVTVKPAAGPVLLLTAPALSPNGELARRGSARSAGEAQALIDRAFLDGHLPGGR